MIRLFLPEEITMKYQARMTLGVLVITMLAASGCATRSSVRDARDQADRALGVAQEANQTAHEADERSQRTEEALHRSFKKSMRK